MIRRWFWPLGPLPVLVPAAAIIAGTLLLTWPVLGLPYPQWAHTSAQWHQAFSLAGPIAAGGAAWCANRLTADDRIYTQPGGSRLGLPVVARQLAILTGWYVGAYVLALLPVTIITATRTEFGSPELWPITIGLLALIAATCVGFLAGTVHRSWITVPVAALIVFAINPLGTLAEERFAVLGPFIWPEPMVTWQQTPQFMGARTALYTAVALAAAAIAAMLLIQRARGSGRNQRWVLIGLCASIPAALAAVSVLNPPKPYSFVADPPRLCETDTLGVRYCVHAAYPQQLGQAVREAGVVLDRYGTKPGTVDLLLDDYLPPKGLTERELRRVVLIGRGETDEFAVKYDLVRVLAGDLLCAEAPNVDAAAYINQDGSSFTDDLAMFLLGNAPAGSFSGMTVDEVQRWIAKNERKLAECGITTKDLPRR